MSVKSLFPLVQGFVERRAPVDDLPFSPRKVGLRLGCRLAEKDYEEDPRYLAHVFHRRRTVCVARKIEDLAPEYVWGILLHEFGHLYGGKSDAEADLWVHEKLGIDIDYVDLVQWVDPPVEP